MVLDEEDMDFCVGLNGDILTQPVQCRGIGGWWIEYIGASGSVGSQLGHA